MNSNEKQPTPLSPEDIERFSPDPMAAFRANLAAVVKRNAARRDEAGRVNRVRQDG